MTTHDEMVVIDGDAPCLRISVNKEKTFIWFQYSSDEDDICFKFSIENAMQISKLLADKCMENAIKSEQAINKLSR